LNIYLQILSQTLYYIALESSLLQSLKLPAHIVYNEKFPAVE